MVKIDTIKIVAGIVLLRGATGSSTTSILLSSKFSLKFSELGLSIDGIFDANPKLIGMRIRDVEIKDIDTLGNYLENNNINIGIICVPRINAQKVCDLLVKGGIKGIWNFAPVDLVVPDDVKVENVHLSESLLTLVYLMK